jgi:hypothetical protein
MTGPAVSITQIVDLTGIATEQDARWRVSRIRHGIHLRILVDRSTWRTNDLPRLLADQAVHATGIDLESEDPRVAADFLELLRPHLAAMSAMPIPPEVVT